MWTITPNQRIQQGVVLQICSIHFNRRARSLFEVVQDELIERH